MKSRDLQKRGGKELSWWESGLGDQVVVCMHLRGGGGAGGGHQEAPSIPKRKEKASHYFDDNVFDQPGR